MKNNLRQSRYMVIEKSYVLGVVKGVHREDSDSRIKSNPCNQRM